MRVAVLPTGRMEWRGLCGALRRRFPAHDFYPVPTPNEWAVNPNALYNGFTSHQLTAHHEQWPPESAVLLIERAAQEALGDRHVGAADAVVVVDDLELCNASQPDRAVRVLRAAVDQHLTELRAKFRVRTQSVLKEKVSFHLIVPMVEAWLFADRSTLVAAGMPPSAAPVFPKGDLEAFIVNDPAYIAANASHCPCWQSGGGDKKRRPKWLGGASRDLHPKGYLHWLCLDGTAKNCTTYDETDGGGRALEQQLDLSGLIGRPRSSGTSVPS